MSMKIKESELKIIRKSTIFNEIDQELILKILKNAVVRKYTRNEIIFFQDDLANSFYVILDGWVKLFQLSAAPEFQREVQHPRPKHFNEFGFDRDGRDRQIFMKS